MPGTPTTRYALPTIDGSADFIKDGDAAINSLAAAIDAKMVGYSEGPIGSIPTSSGGTPGVVGRIYFATDQGRYYIDHGTGWNTLDAVTAKARGKTIIATEEARTNVAYGLMATPDRVSGIVVASDGILRIRYLALVKASVAGAGAAAIFIGSNQLKTHGGAAALSDQSVGFATTANIYNVLCTTPSGLNGVTTYTSDAPAAASTGQALTAGGGFGGVLDVFGLPAGTYDVSVQYKSTSGSVTVKDRRLWVETRVF